MTNNINAYRQWIDQLLAEGKTVNVPVHGMSMFPFLMPGDQVRIRRVGFDEMKPGQVLVFENNGQWIAHRLVRKDIQQKMLITKGDGLPRKDLPVTAGQAKGIIIKVLKTRSPLAWSINTPVDRFMVMVTPLTGWGFWYLGRVVGRVVRWLIG